MAFWHTGDVEPKRNYRFLVELGATTDSMGGTQWWAKTCDTPSWDVSEVEHNFYDNKYYYPGRVSWNEISMTVVDPKATNVVWKLNKTLQKGNYNIKDEADVNDAPTSMSKPSMNGALGQVTITVYDAEGNQVEKWTLKNAWLKSAKFGTLDYSSDELKQVDLTIRYDWCLVQGETGGETIHDNGSAPSGPGTPTI
tara:strand:- start:4823 stop:5410 length:588 start_codon:yes stop_codon:yes gene_type:complete